MQQGQLFYDLPSIFVGIIIIGVLGLAPYLGVFLAGWVLLGLGMGCGLRRGGRQARNRCPHEYRNQHRRGGAGRLPG